MTTIQATSAATRRRRFTVDEYHRIARSADRARERGWELER